LQELISAEMPNNPPPYFRLPYVDLQKCKDREERALAAAEREAAKLGVGVSREAQQVFMPPAAQLPSCRGVGLCS
jgi:protein LSM12